jgi:vacuolar-type H+-ATPase subunit H
VRSVISAAESAAAVIRAEAEKQAQARLRIAEQERTRYLDAARQEADELLRRRVRQISELSDAIIEAAEKLTAQLDGAQDLRRQVERTVVSLAQTAERLADAHSRPGPAVREPEPEREPAPEPVQEHQHESEPEPEPEPEREPDVETVTGTVVEEPQIAEVEVVDSPDEPRVERLRTAPAGNGGTATPPGREEDDDMLAARLVALQMAVAGSPRGEVEEHLRVNFTLTDTTAILNDVFGTDASRLR